MKIHFAMALSVASMSPALIVAAVAEPAATEPATIYVDQGDAWKPSLRAEFYQQDQGSQIIPLAWLKALKQANGQPFLADHLGRYGYLANPDSPDGLPIGFTVAGPAPVQEAGMTCSACHTRDITVADKTYRIDGGPAIADFQAFLTDLDAAVSKVLTDSSRFEVFAAAVFGPVAHNAKDVDDLRRDVKAWYLRYHTLMSKALPARSWGPARLDAVGMIFDRLTGLDLGSPPSFLIPGNIRTADAPVRYPFLWNAPIQDRTQWPGFAANGNDLLGLSRNLGEVLGVFGTFEPKKQPWWHLIRIDYLSNNSANFAGLSKLETLVKQIGKPRWPWRVDTTLAAKGEAIYNRHEDKGGCVDCHGIKKKTGFFGNVTWETPVQDVGTDTREYNILGWTAATGVLDGASIPFLTKPLAATDQSFNVLALSVTGSILQHYVPITRLADQESRFETLFDISGKTKSVSKATQLQNIPPNLRVLQEAFRLPGAPDKTKVTTTTASGSSPVNAYEARVLEGIWAAAPYLHNGSVPTLADLLKPAADRPARFKVGPAYDTTRVGLAAEQTKFDYTLVTTDCSDVNSGDSRCGHEYGTKTLTEDEKTALLEYLKTL